MFKDLFNMESLRGNFGALYTAASDLISGSGVSNINMARGSVLSAHSDPAQQNQALEAMLRENGAAPLYDKLSEENQDRFSRMILDDEVFARKLEDAVKPGEGGSTNAGMAVLNQVPEDMMNAIVVQMERNPEFRHQLIDNMGDFSKVQDILAREQAADAQFKTAMDGTSFGWMQKLGGAFQSLMSGDFGGFFNQIFEMVFGKSMSDLTGSLEMMVQGGGPEGGITGMLRDFLNPSAAVTTVQPDGSTQPVRAAELGQQPDPAAEAERQQTLAATPGLTMGR